MPPGTGGAGSGLRLGLGAVAGAECCGLFGALDVELNFEELGVLDNRDFDGVIGGMERAISDDGSKFDLGLICARVCAWTGAYEDEGSICEIVGGCRNAECSQESDAPSCMSFVHGLTFTCPHTLHVARIAMRLCAVVCAASAAFRKNFEGELLTFFRARRFELLCEADAMRMEVPSEPHLEQCKGDNSVSPLLSNLYLDACRAAN